MFTTLLIGSFFIVRSMYFSDWLIAFNSFIIVWQRLKLVSLIWIIWEKSTSEMTSSRVSIVCVCVCVIERQINTCLIAVSDNCREVWRELMTSQPVAHYLWLLDTAGRFYCCIISVGGSGQWRNFYRHIHGLFELKIALKKCFKVVSQIL